MVGNLKMSHDEQSTVLGRLVLERKDAQQQLVLLGAEARRIGKTLAKLGRQLQDDVCTIQFFDVPSEIRYRIGTIDSFDRNDLDAARLVTLIAQIREQTQRLEDLDRDLKAFGV